MKAWIKGYATLVLALVGLALQAQDAIDPQNFKKALQGSQVQLLDVRTDDEFRSGHLPHAMLADYLQKEQFYERVKYLDKSQPVYIYCLSGARSAAAAHYLRENGYAKVVELKGGINAWKQARLPLEAAANIAQMTEADYQSALRSKQFVLVDFGANWCPPCRQMEPVVKAVLEKHAARLRLVKVDAGVNTRLMKQFNVETLPVFILYKNGQQIWRRNGVFEKEELEKVLAAN